MGIIQGTGQPSASKIIIADRRNHGPDHFYGKFLQIAQDLQNKLRRKMFMGYDYFVNIMSRHTHRK
jgi:hypothetical protein